MGTFCMGAEGKTILLVEDEQDIRESLRDLLEAGLDGANVLMAEGGPEGLAILAEKTVHLIVSDYRMPGMDGLEFLRKAADFSPDAPRMILTAFPKLELAITAINEIEVSRFLTKPIRPADFLAEVTGLLEGDAAPTPPPSDMFSDALGS